MSRVTPAALSVLACLALAPVAYCTEPTTQPTAAPVRIHFSNAKEFEVAHRGGIVYGNVVVPTTQPMHTIPKAWPYLRVGPPSRNVPRDWFLKNRQSNTWHYIVPVGSDF
jgi:hypothetical protein